MNRAQTTKIDNNIYLIDSIISATNELISEIKFLAQSDAILTDIADIYVRHLENIVSIADETKKDNNKTDIHKMVPTFMEFDSIWDENNLSLSSILDDRYFKLRGMIYHLQDLIDIEYNNTGAKYYSKTYSENIVSGKLKQLEKRQQSVLNSIQNSEEKYNKSAAERELKFNKIINSRLQEAIDLISSAQIDALKKITEKESELITSTEMSLQKVDLLSQHTLNDFIHDTKSKSDTFKTEIEEIRKDSIEEMHSEILQEIRLFSYAKKRLYQLLDAAGNDVLAKDNLKQAETERKSANILRMLGFIFLLLSVGYIAIEIGKLVSGNVPVTLELVLIRLIVTLVLMVPSIYLLKESARHRADERSFRKKGIHLATIDSYLANFDDASKVDMKKQLTASFFDNKDTVVDYSTITDMNSSLTKLLEVFVEKVKKEDPTPMTTSAKQEVSSTK